MKFISVFKLVNLHNVLNHPAQKLCIILLWIINSTLANNLNLAYSEYTVSARSVKEWAVCDGVTDDSVSFAQAIFAARHSAFTLIVDCPLYLRMGMDISKPIFIDNETTIDFNSKGLVIVDNVLIPAFILANSSNINLLDWKIQYTGGIPIDDNIGGYYNDGVFVTQSGKTPAAHAFNNITLKNWLQQNRGVTFAKNQSTIWTGPLDPAAIFYLKGNTFNIKIKNMSLFVSESTSADKFIPIAFSLNPGEMDNQNITANLVLSKPYLNTPHDIFFDNIMIDGYYFGWHGAGQNISIRQVTTLRYGDLQDSAGENVGGINKWFPPPHLFYFNTQDNWDSSLKNTNFLIENIIDNGIRLGVARDKGGNDTISGHAVSLKIQANNSLIQNYVSYRPDGFMDILSSSNVKFKNMTAIGDSSFINYTLPMMRFTQKSNHDLYFESISLTDSAVFTYIDPIRGSDDDNNTNIIFINTRIKLNNWGEPTQPMYHPKVKGTAAYFAGVGHNFDIRTSYLGESSHAPIIITNTTQTNFNNTLRNIPIGSFGLRSYTVQNNTSTPIYELTFPKPTELPANISYDNTRSNCNLNNHMSLAVGASCQLVFKYQPIAHGINSYFILKLLAIGNTEQVINSDDYYIPFSVRY